jgi:penicillin-binding protein activator
MFRRFLTVALIASLSAACSGTRYGDPNSVETVNIQYGLSDLQALAGGMIESLIAAPQLNYFMHPSKDGGDPRIVMLMGGVENRTSEHVDTKGITDSMRVKLLNSGKFRFTAGDQGQAEIEDQVRFQQGTGKVLSETAKAFGQQVGADMILYGVLRSYEKERDRSIETLGSKTENVDYQFTLQLVNIETAEIVWAGEELVRKTKKTGLFGS